MRFRCLIIFHLWLYVESVESSERDWQEPGYPDDNAVLETYVSYVIIVY